jgi:hypothetical protein
MDSDELRGTVRASLPSNIIDLMDGIERFAGREIAFEFNPHPAPTEYPNSAACYVREDKAAILLRAGAQISAQDILHELLHIQRYWMEHAPQLEPLLNQDSNWDVTGRIENVLEHLVIVPREANFGFAPRPQWDEVARREWGAYPWPDNTEQFSRSLGSHLGWLTCEIVTDPQIRTLAKECLVKDGTFESAENLRQAVKRYLANKPKALLFVLRAVGLPRAEFQLAYIDIKRGKKRCAKLPLL